MKTIKAYSNKGKRGAKPVGSALETNCSPWEYVIIAAWGYVRLTQTVCACFTSSMCCFWPHGRSKENKTIQDMSPKHLGPDAKVMSFWVNNRIPYQTMCMYSSSEVYRFPLRSKYQELDLSTGLYFDVFVRSCCFKQGCAKLHRLLPVFRGWRKSMNV